MRWALPLFPRGFYHGRFNYCPWGPFYKFEIRWGHSLYLFDQSIRVVPQWSNWKFCWLHYFRPRLVSLQTLLFWPVSHARPCLWILHWCTHACLITHTSPCQFPYVSWLSIHGFGRKGSDHPDHSWFVVGGRTSTPLQFLVKVSRNSKVRRTSFFRLLRNS